MRFSVVHFCLIRADVCVAITIIWGSKCEKNSNRLRLINFYDIRIDFVIQIRYNETIPKIKDSCPMHVKLFICC